jgi:septum site-determining protein MinC
MEVFSTDRTTAETTVSAFTRPHAAFDLKGIMSSLTVLRLRSRDLNLIERQLRAKVTQFPQFFQDAPVVLDLAELEGGLAGFPLAALVRALSVCRVVPVAVANIDDAHRSVALAAGLGVVSLNPTRGVGDAAAGNGGAAPPARNPAPPSPDALPPELPAPTPNAVAPPAGPAPASSGDPVPAGAQPPAPATPAGYVPSTHRAPVLIRQPVRSGQVVYAEKNDLIVLAPVNPGAQLVADGNIHVYAPLRGRAVAGAGGFAEARVFCQKLEAELIAISGAYVTFDDIPPDRLGKPAQVFVRQGECVILPL